MMLPQWAGVLNSGILGCGNCRNCEKARSDRFSTAPWKTWKSAAFPTVATASTGGKYPIDVWHDFEISAAR
jgi:hypothetical protein